MVIAIDMIIQLLKIISTLDQNFNQSYFLTSNDNTRGAMSKDLKNKFRYLYNFRGTSKSAPLITGLLSLLQNKLNERNQSRRGKVTS